MNQFNSSCDVIAIQYYSIIIVPHIDAVRLKLVDAVLLHHGALFFSQIVLGLVALRLHGVFDVEVQVVRRVVKKSGTLEISGNMTRFFSWHRFAACV